MYICKDKSEQIMETHACINLPLTFNLSEIIGKPYKLDNIEVGTITSAVQSIDFVEVTCTVKPEYEELVKAMMSPFLPQGVEFPMIYTKENDINTQSK